MIGMILKGFLQLGLRFRIIFRIPQTVAVDIGIFPCASPVSGITIDATPETRSGSGAASVKLSGQRCLSKKLEELAYWRSRLL